MLGQVEDPTAATLEWSSILLRSFFMDAGLSMVDMDAPYISYYMDQTVGAGLVDPGGGTSGTGSSAAGGGGGSYLRMDHQQHKMQDEDDDDDDMRRLIMQPPKKKFNMLAGVIPDSSSVISGSIPAAASGSSMCGSVASGSSMAGSVVTVDSNIMQRAMGSALTLDTSLVPQQQHSVGSVCAATDTTSAAAVVSPWLDPRIWSKLPEKLVERVVASLPLPSFFRSRLVCKRWYSLLFSDSFLEVCAKVRKARPWFLLFRRGDWSQAFVFDAMGRSWFRLDLSFLPPNYGVVAAAGGLLCCISEARGCKTVLVCNPLTRVCVQLPSALKERFVPTVGLVIDTITKAYRVLVAGDDLISPFAVKNLTTEVYDSRSQQWRMTAPLPRLCNLESGKTTYANGFFYCMNYSPFSVLAYDTEHGIWSKIQAPMRRFLRTPNLVECRGRLVLVAAVEKNKLNVPKSIRIWGLQHSRTSWVELERMPQGLYEDFMHVSGHKPFHCIGHGNLILITLADCPDMVIYDFYEKVWRWAPRCPFAAAAGHPGSTPNSLLAGPQGFHAFAFDPSLEASVF